MSTPEVLVVDDDADIRESLALALELDGFSVACARNGEEAWTRLLGGAAPGLVLLDLAMPVLGGAELLARIRGDARLQGLPVVVITAFGALAADVRARADACLHKPLDLDTILALASRHCGPRAAGRA